MRDADGTGGKMRVAVVSGRDEPAGTFACRLQREFAAHGIASETEAMPLADVWAEGKPYDAYVLLPQVAYAKRDIEQRSGARAWVAPLQDFRRLNTKKIANDLALLIGV